MMENALAAAIGALGGVYVIRVGVAGNSKELLSLLAGEPGYLEFLVALYILYRIHELNGPIGELADQLMWAALLAALIKMVASHTDVFGELQKYGSGQQSLFTSLAHIVGIK